MGVGEREEQRGGGGAEELGRAKKSGWRRGMEMEQRGGGRGEGWGGGVGFLWGIYKLT